MYSYWSSSRSKQCSFVLPSSCPGCGSITTDNSVNYYHEFNRTATFLWGCFGTESVARSTVLIRMCRPCIEKSRLLSKSEMQRAKRYLTFSALAVCLTSLIFYIHYTLAPTQVVINYVVGDFLGVSFLTMIWGLSIANLVVVYDARKEVQLALDTKPFLRFMDADHKGQFSFSNPTYAAQFTAINPSMEAKHSDGILKPRYYLLSDQLIGPILIIICIALVSLLA